MIKQILKKTDEYNYNIKTFANAVKISEKQCEELGETICSIWIDSINESINMDTIKYTYDTEKNEYRDFSNAISTYISSEEYKNLEDSISYDFKNITDMYKLLQELPKSYSDESNYIKEIYDTYSLYKNLVLSPTGNYNTYSDQIYSYNNIENTCDTLISILPKDKNETYFFTNKKFILAYIVVCVMVNTQEPL